MLTETRIRKIFREELSKVLIDDKPLNAKEAASYLGCSVETLDNYRKKGMVKFKYRSCREVTIGSKQCTAYYGISYSKIELNKLRTEI